MSSLLIKDFRYERKFLVDQLDRHQARSIVKRHPSLFYEPFPPRFINNLYLDTKEMKNYHDNVDGAADRQKVRIRWYGELMGGIKKPVLEFKTKRGMVGSKQQYRFSPFTLDDRFDDHYYQEILANSDLPGQVSSQIRDMNVVLMNRYYRWYFATKDNRYRVTLDTGLTYYQVKRFRNSFIHKQVDYSNIVVELKYLHAEDPHANRVAAYFPFSLTKSSKYVMGVERVFL